MTHAVMRGEPTQAQLYMEGVIKELVRETGRQEDRYCLNKILYKCLRDLPDDVRHIEATTGSSETNKCLLERSIKTAHALQHSALNIGDTVLLITRNSLESLGLYFGAIFAGINIFMLHFESTTYELSHLLKLKMPKIIFSEQGAVTVIEEVLKTNNWDIRLVVFGETKTTHQCYSDYAYGYDGSYEKFWPVDTERNANIMTIATSGTTGLPKACELNNRGLSAQLPSLWTNCKKFPKPHRSYFCSTSYSWITMTFATINCAAFGITIIYTSSNLTSDHVRMILRRYRPNVSLLVHKVLQSLLVEPGAEADDFSSLETILMTGTKIPDDIVPNIKKFTSSDALIGSALGMTELHGFVTAITDTTPMGCLGKVFNIMDYKIVDENGKQVGPNESGELLFKSNECMFQSYSNNEEAYKKSFTEDGWYKSGDKVYVNEDEEMFYVERIKFLIKYNHHQISPSELEAIISGVEGVLSAAVCDSSVGPAALVVPLEGANVQAQDIHDVIKGKLNDNKRLRGGIVFVESLPYSQNMKIERYKVKHVFHSVDPKDIHYDANL